MSSAQLPLFDRGLKAPEFGIRTSARARRLTVRVYPGGRVEVTVPEGTGPKAVQRFVDRHRAWIDARVREFRSQPPPIAQPLPGTAWLQAIGESWEIVYLRRTRAGFRTPHAGRVEICGDPADAGRARLALRAWLAAQARRTLPPWLARLATERGFNYQQVQLRRQRTRWGSCSREGTISLNNCLLFQPAPVVRYLLVHELCHTRHLNHSARFWRLVATHEPEWRSLDRELVRGWQHVPAWVYG